MGMVSRKMGHDRRTILFYFTGQKWKRQLFSGPPYCFLTEGKAKLRKMAPVLGIGHQCFPDRRSNGTLRITKILPFLGPSRLEIGTDKSAFFFKGLGR
jgi:hypothetical protein